DLAVAVHRGARRPRQRRWRGDRRIDHLDVVGRRRDVLAHLVGDDVLRHPAGCAADPATRSVRDGQPGGRMSWVSTARGGGFFAALVLLPLLGLEQWQLNMLVFVLMFAVMASAWNLVGGFAGYPSLGHAAFFGIGAYTLGLLFKGQTVS